jgi:HTH-type transcriptional regulator/antitoxin HigA
MAEAGVRFVVVEPLSGGGIDGAAFWLDEHSPVVVLSLRFDRVDAFWITLGHEIAHIRNRDSWSVDAHLVGDGRKEVEDHAEARANEQAAAMLIDREELESFIQRVGPLYSKDRIIQFANRIKIHPGIIVGQLQYRGEIKYSANREMLVKIRDRVLSTALADGWGQSPGKF